MQPPESSIDLFSDETLTHTETCYRALRELGPIVHLPANDLYAVTRFAAVRAALRADDALISGKGVAANDVINGAGAETTLTSDGPVHLRRRAKLMRPLTRSALQQVKQRIADSADLLVLDLRSRGDFCAVRDFAAHLPVSIVAQLVGLEESGRESMLQWAAATFDALGSLNARAQAAFPCALQLIRYVSELQAEHTRQGGWAHAILQAAENGELTRGEGAMMVVDYVAPSLDTTILASAHMLWRLGVTEGAFAALRRDPDLAASVVNESVRLSSPIRGFTRFAAADYQAQGLAIPAGARAAILYASANWDERHYASAHQFRVDRNPRDHVGWGHGAHICAGMHLARMEMEALLQALIRHVTRIEVGTPVPILNNVLQGFQSLPASLH